MHQILRVTLLIATALNASALLGQGRNTTVQIRDSVRGAQHHREFQQVYAERRWNGLDPDSLLAILKRVKDSNTQYYWGEAAGRWHLLFGHAEAKLARMPEALAACDSAVWHAQRCNDGETLAEADALRGQVLVWAGDLDRASSCYERALSGFAKITSTTRVADCTFDIGWIFYLQQRYDLATEKYISALTEYREANDQAGIARIHRGMGLIAADSFGDKTYRIALAHFDTSLRICRAISHDYGLAATYSNMGAVFMYMGNMDRSAAHFDSALVHGKSTADRRLIASVTGTAGEFYLNAKQPRTSLGLCTETLQLAKRSGMLLVQRDAALCMYNALHLLGRHEEANQSLWAYIDLRDSILKRSILETANRRLFQDSLTDAVELANLEGLRLKTEVIAQRRRTQLLVVGILMPVVLLSGIALWRSDRKRRSIRHSLDRASLETQILRAQMNPHFIFNALGSIQNYVEENERDLAVGFLSKFARLMRLVLENSRQNEISVRRDLDALRLYVDLERMRLNNKFDYTISVDPGLNTEEAMLPPLVLQPFVENAIWHGLSPKDGHGHLTLSFRRKSNCLLISIEDDGVGRLARTRTSEDHSIPQTSLGTEITQERLDMFGQQKRGPAGYRYLQKSSGTLVEVTIPMNNES